VVLQVPLANFGDTAQRVLEGCRDVYITPHLQQTLVTASKPGLPVIAAIADLTVDKAKKELQKQGLTVYDGRWNTDLSLEHEGDDLTEVYIAGVAYKTESGPPGIWIDAYAANPTQVQVLKIMYDEMISTGEMTEVSFEEFVRVSEANVVVVGPGELRSFLAEKDSL
jgi:hypothetical protein